MLAYHHHLCLIYLILQSKLNLLYIYIYRIVRRCNYEHDLYVKLSLFHTPCQFYIKKHWAYSSARLCSGQSIKTTKQVQEIICHYLVHDKCCYRTVIIYIKAGLISDTVLWWARTVMFTRLEAGTPLVHIRMVTTASDLVREIVKPSKIAAFCIFIKPLLFIY